MKTLILTFLSILSFDLSASVICHTPRMNKIFEVSDKKVTFFHEFENTNTKRELASVVSRTKSTATGLTRIVDFENQKHTIHIANLQNFSDVDDYIIIKSRTGHEVTYPLTCEHK